MAERETNKRTMSQPLTGAYQEQGENHREVIDVLQKQLEATMEMNKNLSAELDIHQTNVNTSQHNNYARPELQQQLCEIHMLRERLQESIDNNDRLRCLLEKRLLNLGVDADAVRAALSTEHTELRQQLDDLQECLTHRENAICDLKRQLDCAEQSLDQCRAHCSEVERSNNCYKREISYKNDLISELQTRVGQKEDYIQRLLTEADEKNGQVKCLQNENCRLVSELQRTQNRVAELQGLNKEMHCELTNLQQQVEMEGSALSNMLKGELRGLRDQLESTISNSFQLTQHLEDKLPNIPTKFKPGHNCDQTPKRAMGCPPVNCGMPPRPASVNPMDCCAGIKAAPTCSSNRRTSTTSVGCKKSSFTQMNDTWKPNVDENMNCMYPCSVQQNTDACLTGYCPPPDDQCKGQFKSDYSCESKEQFKCDYDCQVAYKAPSSKFDYCPEEPCKPPSMSSFMQKFEDICKPSNCSYKPTFDDIKKGSKKTIEVDVRSTSPMKNFEDICGPSATRPSIDDICNPIKPTTYDDICSKYGITPDMTSTQKATYEVPKMEDFCSPTFTMMDEPRGSNKSNFDCDPCLNMKKPSFDCDPCKMKPNFDCEPSCNMKPNFDCDPCKNMKPNFDWSKFEGRGPCDPKENPWQSAMPKIEARVNALPANIVSICEKYGSFEACKQTGGQGQAAANNFCAEPACGTAKNPGSNGSVQTTGFVPPEQAAKDDGCN